MSKFKPFDALERAYGQDFISIHENSIQRLKFDITFIFSLSELPNQE